MNANNKSKSQLQTGMLGGVEHPSKEELAAMQKGPYILRARGGELTKVPAQKCQLTQDPDFHPQGGQVCMADDNLLYAKQATILSKSTDGGRMWTSCPSKIPLWDGFQVLRDGTFVRVSMEMEHAKGPAKVSLSRDEGETWEDVTEIPIEVPGGYKMRYVHWRMTRLPDNTLFFATDLRDDEYGPDRYLTAATALTLYRSTDGGMTWEGPIKACEWVAEGRDSPASLGATVGERPVPA